MRLLEGRCSTRPFWYLISVMIPEKPILLYPSLARRLGVNAALLLYLCSEQLAHQGLQDQTGARSAVLSPTQWKSLTELWSEAELTEMIAVLSQQQCLQILRQAAGTVHITELMVSTGSHSASTAANLPTVESIPAPDERPVTTRLPVVDAPPAYPRRPLPSRNPIRDRGPAPAFGGSTGWNNRQKDELQQIFDRHEERNQQLHVMHMGWVPSELFYSMLPRHQIPREFVDTCLDEFILYYIDKERKESNWDQKFLAWVKREWVQKQTRDAKAQRHEQQRHTSGINDENTRRDTRENRKRVTAAIMDIKDTDW